MDHATHDAEILRHQITNRLVLGKREPELGHLERMLEEAADIGVMIGPCSRTRKETLLGAHGLEEAIEEKAVSGMLDRIPQLLELGLERLHVPGVDGVQILLHWMRCRQQLNPLDGELERALRESVLDPSRDHDGRAGLNPLPHLELLLP